MQSADGDRTLALGLWCLWTIPPVRGCLLLSVLNVMSGRGLSGREPRLFYSSLACVSSYPVCWSGQLTRLEHTGLGWRGSHPWTVHEDPPPPRHSSTSLFLCHVETAAHQSECSTIPPSSEFQSSDGEKGFILLTPVSDLKDVDERKLFFLMTKPQPVGDDRHDTLGRLSSHILFSLDGDGLSWSTHILPLNATDFQKAAVRSCPASNSIPPGGSLAPPPRRSSPQRERELPSLSPPAKQTVTKAGRKGRAARVQSLLARAAAELLCVRYARPCSQDGNEITPSSPGNPLQGDEASDIVVIT